MRSIPDRFPNRIAEAAHFDLLRELGLTPTQAGLEVIRAEATNRCTLCAISIAD